MAYLYKYIYLSLSRPKKLQLIYLFFEGLTLILANIIYFLPAGNDLNVFKFVQNTNKSISINICVFAKLLLVIY